MKYLWGIRHVRYWLKMVRFNIWWDNHGKYMGAFPNHHDIDHMKAVWRGEE